MSCIPTGIDVDQWFVDFTKSESRKMSQLASRYFKTASRKMRTSVPNMGHFPAKNYPNAPNSTCRTSAKARRIRKDGRQECAQSQANFHKRIVILFPIIARGSLPQLFQSAVRQENDILVRQIHPS